MKRTLLFISIPVIILILLAICLFYVSKSRTFQFFGEITSRIDTEEKIVALTFDDAPTARTEEVLEILSEKDVQATFYLIGERMENYPDMVTYIIEEGHALGNHTYSHPRMLLKSYDTIRREVDLTNDLIRDRGYDEEITFRPPYGKKLFGLPYYLSQIGMKTVMWDVEPETYVSGSAQDLVDYTLDHVQPGSIILLHPFCGEECTRVREALPDIIDGLRERGYRFVRVGEE